MCCRVSSAGRRTRVVLGAAVGSLLLLVIIGNVPLRCKHPLRRDQIMFTTAPATDRQSHLALARRLRPLQVGVALQNMLLWVPVEKMFMTQIGFDAAAIGLVAAVYAAVAPALEVPFGILADRW